MKATNSFFLMLLAPLRLALAQTPGNGSYLICAQPVPNDPILSQWFWDVFNANNVAPTPGVTPITAQFLHKVPPSTPNQQWTVNVLGSVGKSGLYSFSSKISGPKVFIGVDASGKAVATTQETVFNVTASPQFANLYTVQPVGVSGSNSALTSNVDVGQQITVQPIVQGNGLQLWAFIPI